MASSIRNSPFSAPHGCPFILASSSPRRRDLLGRIGLVADHVDPADIDEAPHPREIPRIYAARVAAAKAERVAGRHPGAFILAADTVVALGRRILPKAETEDVARECLRRLSGRRHRVLGAVSLHCPGGGRVDRLVTTSVTMKRLTDQEIATCIACGEWEGKAGGYAIQGLAGAFVTALSGSYSNVVGLPLAETYALLSGNGFRHRPPEDVPE